MNILIFSLVILFLIFPYDAALGAKEGLMLSAASVIGSIFPFMVASKMLILSEAINSNNKSFKVLSKIFHISTNGVMALILGLICGYPMGAKVASDLYAGGYIEKKEASTLLAFCNYAGSAFTISTVGGMFLKNFGYGVIIYISHISGTLLVALLLRNLYEFKSTPNKTNNQNPPHISIILTESIKDSCMGMLNVVGVITFFSSVFYCIKATNILNFLPEAYQGIIYGIFEITAGIKMLANIELQIPVKISLITFILSLGGLSIYCQALSFTAKHKIKTASYLIGKTLSGIFASIICYLIFLFIS